MTMFLWFMLMFWDGSLERDLETYLTPNPEASLDLEFVDVIDDQNPYDHEWDQEPYPSYGIPQVGSVPYSFRISKYELTREQYLPFLNAVDSQGANILELATGSDFELDMDRDLGHRWKLATEDVNLPVEVTWYSATRYCNWLHYWHENGHDRDGSDGTDISGAYDTRYFSDDTFANDTDSHNEGSHYWLATLDEWYKTAYWDSQNRVYWSYPNGSHEAPRGGFPSDPVSYGNMVVSGRDDDPERPFPNQKIMVGSYVNSIGLYGVYDLCGNVAEWSGDRSWNSWLFSVENGRHSMGGHSRWYPDHTSQWAQVGFGTHQRNPTGRSGIRICTSVNQEELDLIKMLDAVLVLCW